MAVLQSCIFLLIIISIANGDGDEVSLLVDLRQQLGNPPAIKGWISGASSPCEMTGVGCQNGSVVSLTLSNMEIGVPVPAIICDIKNLVFLDLSYNNIPGGFPKELYKCTKLQHLDISQNYFVGVIPDDVDALKSLQHLDVSANNFSGSIPSTVGNMAELRVLALQSNTFNGTFPKEIANLQKLEKLLMAYNGFVSSDIPEEFGGLRNLQFLWMRENNIVGKIPESFSNLSNMIHLDLVNNKLEGDIPEGLLSLKNLSYLYLYHNNLSGQIPEKVESLNLMEIDLSFNNLTGRIPEAFGNLKQLQILHLYYNKLSGEVPASLGLLPLLRNFRVFSNNLSGVLPPEMGIHSKLINFEVSNNGFTGELPRNLCAGGALLGVVAFSNNLTGSIPDSLGSCSALITIQLSDNSMSGEIPSVIWSSSSLHSMMINGNSLSGSLPSTLGPNIFWVDISNNKLTGTIPSSISSWKKLVVLDASNNQISGEFPEAATELSTIAEIRMDGNNLTGKLPKNIISWKSLNTLNLSRNNLGGEIPTELGFLPVLTYLDLSQNHLSGMIPSQLGNLKLPILNLSYNQLSGRIPYEFDNLAYGRSFFNNPGLCTANSWLDLPRCDDKPGESNRLSTPMLVVIVVVAVALIVILVTSIFTAISVREYRRRNLQYDKNWKLTSFQRLNFTEATVLESLSDVNIIGSGGSGRVYRVQVDQSSDQYVAVKRIWNRRKLDDKLEKEFCAEIQILGTLKHANIVKLLCCISCDESRLLVYEYLENSSLDRWLHDKKKMLALWSNLDQQIFLDWATRLHIAIGAAQGLCYMHHDCSPPIIHRDIKSSNILLDSEFNAKIADFGLAKMLEREEEARTVSAVVGSLGYIAPEYGYSRRVNEKVDVYSFGVVLLELVTGREPGEGGDHMNLSEWAWKQFADGKPIRDCFDNEMNENGNIEEMTTVFKLGLLCTSKSPSARPTMSDVLHVLKRFTRDAVKEKRKSDVSPLLGNSASYLSSHRQCNKILDAEVDFSLV